MTLNTMIDTIITSLRPFWNKIIDTFHALYIERSSLEALGIWLGYPRGLAGPYIRHSFYNIVYRPFWRLDRLTFPIRYYSAIKLKYLYGWIDSTKPMIEIPLIKKDETGDFEDSKINNIDGFASTHNGSSSDIILPMEVWEIIAHIGNIDNLIMMSINKSFFYTFAPKIYDTLKFTVVLSPLTKMKLTDEAFLKNGPDVSRNNYCDSYSIYKRHQEGQKFDYESLDTSIIDQDYFKGMDPKFRSKHRHPRFKFKSGLRGERSNQPFEVRNLKNIRFILKNILQNPHSIMKMFIKEILIDICVFDGFDKLMNMKQSSLINGSISDHESLDELIDQKTNQLNQHVSVMKLSSNECKQLYVAPLDDNFDRVRWKDPLEDKAIRFNKTARNIKTNSSRESIESDLRHIFPQNVYFKELLCVYLLSGQFYSHRLRRRLSKFENPKNFFKANPINHWCYTLVDNCYNRITKETDLARFFRMIVTGQSCVKIQNREFKTGLQVYELLNDLIKTLTNVKTNSSTDDVNYDRSLNHIESSILILGINNGEPQVSKEFTENASFDLADEVDFTNCLALHPQMILINKSATIT
ncbi:hypothetical protein BN7_269 [Wickerhamomyces ciferrii]|uniref:Uncharacterized protein n=1 Tax=Wickerhamomyces ciferrii (strain ATCC 14091 / BCRC 22168 / CBS 111 / JCM 3599 / NBRC 0793 / NRRL Y-1031 F-60-10) TaxID=1206466 RepID=K0K7D2_WICCF|nr:uncharacterized protein BN7_269 [Wickerhamomyces ciferrii]CCH40735.1 hypothetical protein BN7_269 [Wickerhamomyces ciferrii]